MNDWSGDRTVRIEIVRLALEHTCKVFILSFYLHYSYHEHTYKENFISGDCQYDLGVIQKLHGGVWGVHFTSIPPVMCDVL